MAGIGRISLLVSKDLQRVATVAMNLDREVASRLRRHTRMEAEPILRDEMTGRISSRLQARALLDTARVSVSDTNVMLKTATVGKMSSGVKASVVAPMAEFGVTPTKQIRQRSRKGKQYTRRIGAVAGPPRRKGYVFFPAVREVIPRIASLWMQTAYRTLAETFEKGER
jgi:hypothetical protein